MDNYTDRQCTTERDVTLAEALEACIDLSKRLQAQKYRTATWQLNGSLLRVREDLREVLARLSALENND